MKFNFLMTARFLGLFMCLLGVLMGLVVLGGCKKSPRTSAEEPPEDRVPPTTEEFTSITVTNGRLTFEDGKEVSLFGTNYHPMSWYQYRNMKALDADFRSVLRQDISDMKKMGVQVVRVHVFEREISDQQGALIDNVHLDIFDMLVDELIKQGVYLYLTPLSWWNAPDELDASFSKQVTKMGMMFDEQAVEASKRFVHEFLVHENRYTGHRLVDEPNLALLEILNEPWYFPYAAMEDMSRDHSWHKENETSEETYRKDYETWTSKWLAYCHAKNVMPSEANYDKFQQGEILAYLNGMVAVIRETGSAHPIAAALFESSYNKGVLDAIQESEVDVVTDGWYPGGFEYNEEKNLFEEAINYELPQQVKQKAKVVYEFDIPGTFDNVGMYPAMARRYRSMGAQIACQFQYDSSITAPYNVDWGIHYLNYLYTPAKSVAFAIARKAFNEIPLGTKYQVTSDRQVFGDFAVSFQPYQAMVVQPSDVMYAQTLEDWIPYQLPKTPKHVLGRGNSTFIHYEGSGFYDFQQDTDRKATLYVSPDILKQEGAQQLFTNTSTQREVIKLGYTTHRRLEIKISEWDSFTAIDPAGNSQQITNGEMMVLPGKSYQLVKSNTQQ